MVMELVTGDDWQQLFVDGKLLTENQILDAHDFIEALNTLHRKSGKPTPLGVGWIACLYKNN